LEHTGAGREKRTLSLKRKGREGEKVIEGKRKHDVCNIEWREGKNYFRHRKKKKKLRNCCPQST